MHRVNNGHAYGQGRSNNQLNRNRNVPAQPRLDVGRFRQVINNAVSHPQPRALGPPRPITHPVKPLYLEWKRIEGALKKHRMGNAGFEDSTVPATFEEYLEHKSAFSDYRDAEDDLAISTDMEWERVNRLLARPRFASEDMPAIPDGQSTILGMPTIWTAVHIGLNPYREVAPWPTPDEWREEGDERYTSQFGRFMPVPRRNGNPTVNYKQKPFLIQEELDQIYNVPIARVVYAGVTYDCDGMAYDDEEQAGREAHAEICPFFVDDGSQLMVFGQGAYQAVDGQIVYGAGPYADGSYPDAYPTVEDMAMVLHDPAQETRRSQLLANLQGDGNHFISRALRRARRVRDKLTGNGGSNTVSGSTTGSTTPIGPPGSYSHFSFNHAVANSRAGSRFASPCTQQQNTPFSPPLAANNSETVRNPGSTPRVDPVQQCFELASECAEMVLEPPEPIPEPPPYGLSSFPCLASGGRVMNFNPSAMEFVPASPEMRKKAHSSATESDVSTANTTNTTNSPGKSTEATFVSEETRSRKASGETYRSSGSDLYKVDEVDEREHEVNSAVLEDLNVDLGYLGHGRFFESPIDGRFTAFGHGSSDYGEYQQHLDDAIVPENIMSVANFALGE